LKNIANENGDIREILVNYRDNLVNQLILQWNIIIIIIELLFILI
jgi:hypothetical protein